MPLTRKQREAALTWTLQVKLPSDIPVERAGRFVARLLKYLLRTCNVRCVAVKDNAPAERVES